MTIGQLVECLVGKTAALQGMDADGTSFEEHDIPSVKKTLKSLGYEENGYEYLYNGMTGEKMKVQIFFGPTFYQRLKHLVEDKYLVLVIVQVMASFLKIEGGDIFKLRENSNKFKLLNYFGNKIVALVKNQGYSNNILTLDNPQAKN